jgi:hypothetical protein
MSAMDVDDFYRLVNDSACVATNLIWNAPVRERRDALSPEAKKHPSVVWGSKGASASPRHTFTALRPLVMQAPEVQVALPPCTSLLRFGWTGVDLRLLASPITYNFVTGPSKAREEFSGHADQDIDAVSDSFATQDHIVWQIGSQDIEDGVTREVCNTPGLHRSNVIAMLHMSLMVNPL